LISNFCRNPDGEPSIWCYTTDPNKRWDFCDSEIEAGNPEGLWGNRGVDYRGKQTTT